MMKKKQRILIMLFLLMITVCCLANYSMISAAPSMLKIGDVNGDGLLNNTDAQWVYQYAAGKVPAGFQKDVADVNRDGKINATDAYLIIQYVGGQIPTFPVVNVNVLLSQMSLFEKIGQMIQVEQTAIFDDEFRANTDLTGIPVSNISPDDVTTYAIGSFLTGGDSFPCTARNAQSATVKDWADMYDTLQKKALASRLMIPLIYGADTVHGFGNLQGATIFPHNIGLGATRDADLVRRIGQIVAIEATAAGVDWGFAPVVAVSQDDRWGRECESFSEDPALVSQLGVAYINGLQGTSLKNENSLVACTKHYIGDGGTTWGSGIMAKRGPSWEIIGGFLLDRGDTVCTEAQLRATHLPPYKAAMTQPMVQCGTVMVSFNSWNMTKCHANKYLITDVLKGELGFKGFVCSDWEGFAQINALPYTTPAELETTLNDLLPEELAASINAGIDMLMVDSIWSSWRFKEVMQMIQDLVNNGTIPMSRIDDAVRRILTVKKNLGLFEKPFANRKYQSLVGCAAHREVAREAVRKSLVVLKNNYNILPVRKSIGNICVAGPKANDMRSQCGAWTITWRGGGHLLTGGTTILQAIQNTAIGSKVTFSPDGTVPSGSNVVFVVVGEGRVDAEYFNDRGDSLDPLALSAEDIAVVDKVRSSMPNVPVIGIMLTSSPVIITDQLGKFDALIAAWQPGSEGQGVADILFGDYKPTGKLPFTWPRSVDQIPINDSSGVKNPLFRYGYGLTW
ncbi:MAG: glycoside hydrolase family 3 C-terminal domain-containing protein [Firmicutes bacterium]|nr:glycoside hydrolase family 3 C-terminal domain-containing protein [Bacillota bacterium]